MKKLSIDEAEYIAHVLAKDLFAVFEEPMPDFNTRFPGRLESCLEQPFQTFAGKELYGKELINKAIVLFYLVIKNHPFENGNKRMAVTLMLIFLFKNGYWLKIPAVDLYNLALVVAKSSPKEMSKVISDLQKVLPQYLIKHRQSIWRLI